MKSLKIFNLKNISIYDQLCFEELLLRTTSDNYVILNSNIPSTNIVLGFSGKPHELLNNELILNQKVSVLRRYTGGGTVVVDNHTLFVSLIMNSDEVNCAPYPREIMKWTSDALYSPLFHKLIINKNNLFQLRENDYVWGDKKIAGNAQTIIKNRWCHHTSFLWGFDSSKMKYLKVITLYIMLETFIIYYVVKYNTIHDIICRFHPKDQNTGLIEIIGIV